MIVTRRSDPIQYKSVFKEKVSLVNIEAYDLSLFHGSFDVYVHSKTKKVYSGYILAFLLSLHLAVHVTQPLKNYEKLIKKLLSL